MTQEQVVHAPNNVMKGVALFRVETLRFGILLDGGPRYLSERHALLSAARQLIERLPKPAVPVHGRPILDSRDILARCCHGLQCLLVLAETKVPGQYSPNSSVASSSRFAANVARSVA